MATYKAAPSLGYPPPQHALTESAAHARQALKSYGDMLRASRAAAVEEYAASVKRAAEAGERRAAPRLARADLPPAIARAYAKLERHGDVVALGIVGRVVVLAVQRRDGVRARVFYRWAGKASTLRADGAIIAGRAMTMTAALAELGELDAAATS
jgi:hypothetical protein